MNTSETPQDPKSKREAARAFARKTLEERQAARKAAREAASSTAESTPPQAPEQRAPDTAGREERPAVKIDAALVARAKTAVETLKNRGSIADSDWMLDATDFYEKAARDGYAKTANELHALIVAALDRRVYGTLPEWLNV
jgi:hypothetical protein